MCSKQNYCTLKKMILFLFVLFKRSILTLKIYTKYYNVYDQATFSQFVCFKSTQFNLQESAKLDALAN